MGNATKFPSGMKSLADYVHSKGLLFGIYADSGYRTLGIPLHAGIYVNFLSIVYHKLLVG